MGKVNPNFSGVGHRGSRAWTILPRRLRGIIIQAPKAPKAKAVRK